MAQAGPGLGCWTLQDADIAGDLGEKPEGPRGPKAKLVNLKPWVEPRPPTDQGSCLAHWRVCKMLSHPVPVVVKDEEMK